MRGSLTERGHFGSTALSRPVDPDRSATTAPPLSIRDCRLRRRKRPRTAPIQKVRIGLRQTAATMNHPIKVRRPPTASGLPRTKQGHVGDVMANERRASGGKHQRRAIPRLNARPRPDGAASEHLRHGSTLPAGVNTVAHSRGRKVSLSKRSQKYDAKASQIATHSK